MPASSCKLRVLAASASTVCMNFKSPPVCRLTSVNTFTMSLNTALPVVLTCVPLRWVSPAASVVTLLNACKAPNAPPITVVPLSVTVRL